MAAPTEVYVDPAIAADSGTGTIGDPFGDLQYALNTATRDATNGNRFNIKAGTAEVLAAQLSLATYGTPTADVPLLFEGYTAAAGDGGIGDLNGNGGNFTIVPSNQFQIYKNLKLRNTGTAAIVPVSLAWITFDSVEFSSSTNSSPVNLSGGRVIRCHFHTFSSSGQGVLTSGAAGNVFTDNYFDVGDVLAAINWGSADGGLCTRNIINVSGAAAGIRINNVRGAMFSHNSILGASATGSGIRLNSGAADGAHILNNIISGFSGAGGDGIDIGAGSRIGLYGYNYLHNNTAHETGVSGNVLRDLGDNEQSSTDPFAKSGANTFANRFAYFAPVDSGNLQGGAYPTGSNLDKGAVQHTDPAGGGGVGIIGG